MTATNLDALRTTAQAATEGPWTWDTGYRVPTLEGVKTEVYSEDDVFTHAVPVLEIDHDGGCACRSLCELEVTLSDEDKAFVAAFNPKVALELLARLEAAEARVAELEG